MKKIIVLLLAITPILVFSQGAVKTEINWISLEKAKQYANKYNKNILVYFFKKDCPYCEVMNKETLKDIDVVNLINNNFFSVKIDSRTKDTIIYNGIAYGNQQPQSSGRNDWRHDFYAEVASFTQNGTSRLTTPSIVIFNNKFEKINVFPGKQAKPLFLRRVKPYIK
tara:strand:+ start:1092 stop:1592 length:501 start_codon:yes stop_codon:yes gene_type:complete